MWTSRFRSCVVACAFVLGASAAWARDVPALEHRVTDLANLLPEPQSQRIEALLKSYQMRTGRQFALLIVPSLEDEPIEMYSIRVLEAWKLGRKPHDDGLLLLVAVHERRARIEVGYGLEADITDALSSQIIRNILKPAFRHQTYGEGIVHAFDVLMAAADKSPVEGLLPADSDDAMSFETKLHIAVWCLFITILFISSFAKRRGPPGSGGIGGSRGGSGLSSFLLGQALGQSLGDFGDRSDGGGGGFDGGGGSFGGGGASGDW